jgi:phosphomannomutase
MRKDDILFGAELSGHYYHRDYYFCEAPLFVLFKLMAEIKEKPLSKLLKPYQKYFHSGEINFAIADKKAALDKLKSRYGDGRVLEIDGLRVDYKDWWFLARPSNTEPVLRLVIEADTEELLEQRKKELSAILS